MLKFNNEGITVSVKLPKSDYTIYMMANYIKEKDSYRTKTYISKSGIDDLTRVNIDFEFKSDYKKVKYDMAEHITEMYFSKKYDYYIDLYEYAQKCFDKGVELMESDNVH